MSVILAIDIGTSSAKTLLFDTQTATILAVVSREYPVNKPTPDRAEQNPQDWWEAVANAVPRLMQDANITPDAVVGIGLTGQMHGTVLLDNALEPVSPAIIWADQRSVDSVDALVTQFGAEAYARMTGTLPATGFMVATLHWLAQHQPDVLAKTHKIMLPKDYVRLRLTGEVATDISDAASTGMFNVSDGVWARDVATFAGVDASKLPDVFGSAQVAGNLTTTAAQHLGLQAGIPVVAGCADQPAQALTNGLTGTGIASVTIGTGGQVFVPLLHENRNTPLPTDPRLHVFNHALPDQWYVLGAILSAGSALKWLRNLLGMANDPDAYARLSAEAENVPIGADGLLFMPYLTGERTPHMDPMARGAFIGLSDYHGRGHMARAVMEGVTLALKQTLDISLQLAGAVDNIIISGGGSESAVWRSIQADIFGVPLRKTTQPEQTSMGATILAGMGAGVFNTYEDALTLIADTGSAVYTPNSGNHARYMALSEQFNDLYPRLKADFHKLHQFTNK